MPIHHVDLAVADVERSLAFYRTLLGPLGWTKELRYPTYRGTEEVVYLQEPTTRTGLGVRPADEGEYRYYSVGIEHLRSRSTSGMRSTPRTRDASHSARTFTSLPRKIVTSRTTTHSSSSIQTGFELKSCGGSLTRRRASGFLNPESPRPREPNRDPAPTRTERSFPRAGSRCGPLH